MRLGVRVKVGGRVKGFGLVRVRDRVSFRG